MYFSVVIPHYNCENKLLKCLTSLNRQSFLRKDYEIIVIDNGTPAINCIEYMHLVDCWFSYSDVQDPYNCRNFGIKNSNGKYIALTDAKCVLDKDWLISAKELIENNNLAMVAGNFDYELNENNAYQLAYSLLYLDNEKAFKKNSGFVTGNLFAKKSLFDRYGYFRENLRARADLQWTIKIRKTSERVGFSKRSKATYTAKNKMQLIDSASRDGRALKKLRKSFPVSFSERAHNIVYHCSPYSPFKLWHSINKKPNPVPYRNKFWKIWIIMWRVNFRMILNSI